MEILALNEFKSLQENNVFSMLKVEWWLMKYDDYYKQLSTDWYCPNKGCAMIVGGNCFCKSKSDEYKFLELFKSLDVLSQYQRKEEYFKEELECYYTVKDDPIKLKELVIKNEEIGLEGWWDFLLGYLNYCDNAVLLRAFEKSFLGYDVFIDNNDFKYNIEFLDLFNDLFWVEEIYPESKTLLDIKRKMENRPDNLVEGKSELGKWN